MFFRKFPSFTACTVKSGNELGWLATSKIAFTSKHSKPLLPIPEAQCNKIGWDVDFCCWNKLITSIAKLRNASGDVGKRLKKLKFAAINVQFCGIFTRYLPGQEVNCKWIIIHDSFLSGIVRQINLSVQFGLTTTLWRVTTKFWFNIVRVWPFSLGQ